MDIFPKSYKIVYTLFLITIMLSSSIAIGGRDLYWLGIFPILSILGGVFSNIIITTLSYIFLPKSLTGVLIVLGITLITLIIGHILSDFRPWLNFRILTNIYALVICVQSIMNKTTYTSISFFNMALAVVMYLVCAAFIFWKDSKDYSFYLQTQNEKNEVKQRSTSQNSSKYTSYKPSTSSLHLSEGVEKTIPVSKIENYSVHTSNRNTHDVVFDKNRNYQNVNKSEDSSDKLPNVIDPNEGTF